MHKLSFEIRTAKDFYKKLLEDYRNFLKDSTSSSLALNAGLSAWNLVEWVYHDLQHGQKYTLGEFQKEIKCKCPSLQIMHDLANGAKHFRLDWHKPIIDRTGLHKGDFSNDFSSDYDISVLKIDLKDGITVLFEDEITECIQFWDRFLIQGKPEVSLDR
jgi:hypothetical protein